MSDESSSEEPTITLHGVTLWTKGETLTQEERDRRLLQALKKSPNPSPRLMAVLKAHGL